MHLLLIIIDTFMYSWASGVARGGQWGQLPPTLGENPELHCILLLHNFTVQICQMRFSKG